jgi:bifunctional aspartokinase / homoserine dehydrogenase 1
MANRSSTSPKNQTPTLVMKFGGTSIGTPNAISQAAEIVRKTLVQWPRLVVVVSALAKVTDLLLDSAARSVEGDLCAVQGAESQLRDLHFDIAENLCGEAISHRGQDRCSKVKQEIDELIVSFSNLCKAVAVLGEATPRALDAIVSHGERMSVRLMAEALVSQGVPARMVDASRLVVTDDNFQGAHPNLDATTNQVQEVLKPILVDGIVPVVTGFLGSTPNGITTTLGRGGSDYSASLIGAALQADDVWIWTDVDGVMSADPHIIPEASTIQTLTYREIAEMAYFGARVLHPKAIRPVIEAGIGLRICNTFNPTHPGTRLVPNGQRNGDQHGCLKAVTAIRGQRMVIVEGRGMLGVPGVAARTFGAVASTGASVSFITQASSEQSICFAVQAEAAEEIAAALKTAFSPELAVRDIDCIQLTGEVSIITVIGTGINNIPGIAGQIFSALGSQGVNVIAIAQGSTEVALNLVVEQSDAHQAVRAIHDLILSGLA